MDFISYIHMMSSTQNWAVVVVYPVSMDFTTMFEHNMHPIETIVQLNESTKFVLMDLKDGWSRIDSFTKLTKPFSPQEPSLRASRQTTPAWCSPLT